MQKAEGGLINKAEVAQLKALEKSETEACPTCGHVMEQMEGESEEVGGSHGVMARLTKTDFPGYKTRQLKKGEKVGGPY
jgi:hypothetical protein